MRMLVVFCLGCLFCLSSCRERKLFERVAADDSGLHFNNQITESDSINILDFEYLFNGGGVGIGDVNSDGLPDVFFSGSQVPSRLFLNRGNLHFEDVTKAAGLKAPYWSTGVSMVDINADGRLDIYLCTVNPHRGESSPNQLFMNLGSNADGIPQFRDVAAEVGLADKGYSTQAAFFDYDRDGDMDCYLLTNALEQYNRNEPHGQSADGLGRSTDRLYRNDGVGQGAWGRGQGLTTVSGSAPPAPRSLPHALHFTNVSKEEGIQIEGWGLGVAIADFNADGWPDVYCANDFQSSDLLWINEHANGKHTGFTNRVSEYMKHGSFNAMGIDVADLNNDGWPELMTLDMMPEDNRRQKSMFSSQNYDRHQLALSMGYQPQYVRNVLQLNRGPQPGGGHPVFSEVGQQAGIYATDWSWSTLFADFDNDGWRDVLVTNGYPKDITDLDFINYTSQLKQAYFRNDSVNEQKNYQKMLDLIGVKKSNWAFRNRLGDANVDRSALAFEDVTERWGLSIPSYSNGAAYADLDNDGDLDLVINNINDDAFLYRNTLNDSKKADQSTAHFLRIHLKGPSNNPAGFGANVEVWTNGQKQTTEHTVTRGFVSSVEPAIHFGLGNVTRVDSVKVRWPDGHVSKRINLSVDQVLAVDYRTAQNLSASVSDLPESYFTEITGQRGLIYVHHENEFVDFKQQVLLSQQYSRNGPGLAVGDVDGNNLDDVFVGGASESAGQLFLQMKPGQFLGKALPKENPRNFGDDLGALFLDADGDGDLDLYVAVGGNEFPENDERYQDRLYLNDGDGTLTPAPSGSLPDTRASGSCVVAADYDRDGDLDLFVGGRVVPRKYPMPARNYLLRNDSERSADGRRNAKFTDVTPTNLRTAGLVCAALWTDSDNDGWPDLFLAGEWMPLTFYRNSHGKLGAHQPMRLPNSTGWWNSLAAGDFDNDGDIDYVAGNVGLNNPFDVTSDQPLEIVAKDFDQNGTLDPILSHYIQKKPYPSAPRDQLADQIPSLKKRFTSYEQYGQLTIHDLVENKDAEGAYTAKATQFASCYVENKGKGLYEISPLPALAQIAPVFGMYVDDVNEDDNLDLLLVGNFYATNVLMGRYDAGKGLLLRGDGQGHFSSVSLDKTGLFADRDAKALAVVATGPHEKVALVSNTNDTLQTFRFMPANANKQISSGAIQIRPDDVAGSVTLANGKKRRIEFYYGMGYLSQSSRMLPTAGLRGPVVLIDSRGRKRTVITH